MGLVGVRDHVGVSLLRDLLQVRILPLIVYSLLLVSHHGLVTVLVEEHLSLVLDQVLLVDVGSFFAGGPVGKPDTNGEELRKIKFNKKPEIKVTKTIAKESKVQEQAVKSLSKRVP